MPKQFYTEKDIEDLVQRGVKSLQVTDEVVLTELAYEKARRLGLQLVTNLPDTPPAAPPEYDAMMQLFADKAAVDKRMEPLLKPRVSIDAYERAVELMSTPITVPLIPEVVGSGKTPRRPWRPSTRRELGGPVMPYHSYMVGEAGPELFVPNAPGKIISNQRLTNDNRSTVINNYFTIATKDETPIRELARLLTREQQRTGVR